MAKVTDDSLWWVQEMVQYLRSDESLTYGLRRGRWRLAQGISTHIEGLSSVVSKEELDKLRDLVAVSAELCDALAPVMQEMQDLLSDIRVRLVGPKKM